MRFHIIKSPMSIGRVVVLLFSIANSGFTTVLHYCTMEEMACCETSAAMDHMACGQMLPLQSLSYTQPSTACHTNTIVGGLNIHPAVLEKENKALDTKLEVVPSFAPLHTSLSPQKTTSAFFFLFSEGISPRLVEKYILNGSFLI